MSVQDWISLSLSKALIQHGPSSTCGEPIPPHHWDPEWAYRFMDVFPALSSQGMLAFFSPLGFFVQSGMICQHRLGSQRYLLRI